MSDLNGGRPVSIGSPLVVPVHLDALCLTDDLDVRGPDNDFSRLPYRDATTGLDQNEDLPYVSEIMARTPFQDDDFRLRAGIHLHWALPDGLTRMVQRADGTTAVPVVPNRWLVTRSRDGRVEEEWVVESDYLSDDNPAAIRYPVPGAGRPYRRLGRKLPLDVWSRSADRSRYLPELTAVGYGEPTFAAQYANCHSVFGFHDPDYVGAPPKGLRYEVLGWFDDHGQDPAAALSDGSAAPGGQSWQEAARLRFGWTASTVGPEAPPPGRVVCYAQLTFAATGIEPSPLLSDPDDETGVCVGNTATEALAAHLGSVLPAVPADQVEELLEALAFADELESKPLDLGFGLSEARHSATFHDVPSGILWTLRRQDDTDKISAEDKQARERLTVPHVLGDRLNLLNVAQADVDRARHQLTSAREQLFADWYKYQLCAYPYDALRDSYPDQDETQFFIRRSMRLLAEDSGRVELLAQRLRDARAAVEDSLKEFNAEARLARSTFVLHEIPAPAYRLPNDPVVLMTGKAATPGDRHGQDGALHPQGLLDCAPVAGDHMDLSVPKSVRALRVAAVAAVAKLPVPNFAVTEWTGAPWHPTVLEWEVEFFPATIGNNNDPRDRGYSEDFVTGNYVLPPRDVELQPIQQIPDKGANVYTGTTILSPGARPLLSSRVLRYLQGALLPLYNASGQPEVTREAFLSDPAPVLDWSDSQDTDRRLALLVRIYRHLAAHEDSNLSAVLSGFNDALLMRKLTRQLPVADPLGFPDHQRFAADLAQAVGAETRHAPQPLSGFNPIRAGALRVLRLRMLDNFGTAREVDVSGIRTTTQLRMPEQPDWVAMPPRLAQPARLSFEWLDAEDDIRQTNGLPDTSPICGWLIPDHLDAGLAVYAADGSALGKLHALPDAAQPKFAQWRELPGGTSGPIEAIANSRLRAVAQRLHDTGPAVLGTFLEDLDTTLQYIEPEDYAQHRGRAVLMGRPLAVVRARVSLELMGRPANHQDWNVFRQDMGRTHRETNDFPSVRFPVRIGEHQLLDDGVLGFWLEDSAQRLGPHWHDVRSPEDPLVQALDAPPQYLTMLIDPRGTVHATAGILPTHSLRIPSGMFRDALEGMAVSFRAAPVLTDADRIAVPLPDEPGYAWSWQEQGQTGAVEQADPPRPDARFPARATLREGWLTLRPVSDPQSEQGAR
ncbi:hypothetical protein PV396_07985 [Streptomyces sp. ME02-8801-2C]|uniref:hypothetical protein n=1 Tax=Streptomyces sp. ME02-8801-2C TaxID=3028680 RepID=UPI0029A8A7B5|nr:hypothetical protein [Streptomyces sp. ME02-8801-2C]MDX3451884.1 hypothetical protein [Streptomyces sp. ME02-8801-2C]